MKIQIKRVYEAPEKGDGLRILVDRMWPRGISKERAAVDFWLRNVAPSGALCKWFGHRPERWVEFEARYHQELAENQELLSQIGAHGAGQVITLLYAAKDEEHNNAVALAEYLKR